jgi:hypothetical protein
MFIVNSLKNGSKALTSLRINDKMLTYVYSIICLVKILSDK